MKTKTKLSILTAWIILSVTSSAFADKLCLQTTVNRKTFKVTNKSVRAVTCPKGFTELADTSSFQGPQGPAGAQGAAGIVNLGACRLDSFTCNHPSGVNSCTANCTDGEFVLQHAYALDGNGCNPDYLLGSGTYSLSYSNGLGAGIRLTSSAGCNYTAIINVLCCPVS